MTPKQKNKILVGSINEVLDLTSKSGGLTNEQRQDVYDQLASALDQIAPETFKETISFTTTHNVSNAITNTVSDLGDFELYNDLIASLRGTKQRVYFSLKNDPILMRRFRKILVDARLVAEPGVRRAFERLIKLLDSEVLNVSALEHLARVGL